MRCPKCRDQGMQLETWPGTEIERCPRCQGIFLDRGELEQLLVSANVDRMDAPWFTPLSEQQDMEPATCDRCLVAMEPFLGPRNMRLDRCPRCGATFLDQGELSEIRRADPTDEER